MRLRSGVRLGNLWRARDLGPILERSPDVRIPLSKPVALAVTAAALLCAAPTTASAATCSGTTASSYAQTVVTTPGLVSYWRLGEASGTSACDSYGSNAGAYQGGFRLGATGAIAGDPDTATTFDGSTATVSVAHSASLDVGDSFTVEAWVKRAAFGAPDYQAIASQQANAWLVAFNAANKLVLRQAKVGDLMQSTRTITDTSWHHVAVTKSGATVRMYIDGADVSGSVTNRTMANNTLPLVIGQSSGTAFLNGTVDEVAVYAKALTPAQVANHYNKGRVAG